MSEEKKPKLFTEAYLRIKGGCYECGEFPSDELADAVNARLAPLVDALERLDRLNDVVTGDNPGGRKALALALGDYDRTVSEALSEYRKLKGDS